MIIWRRDLAMVLLASMVVLLLSASPAEAKVFFADVGGKTFEWDAPFSSTILGCPGNDSCRDAVGGTVVYLRRGARTRSRPNTRTLERVGRISASGTLRFRVPHVRAGRYHLLAQVRTDAGQRWFPVSGTFRIRRP